MKIAFVSDDHQTISAHYGKAKFFEIYVLQIGKVIAHETVAKSNPQVIRMGYTEHQPNTDVHNHDHTSMMAPILDCEVLITRGIGKSAHNSLIENDIQPIVTDIQTIQDALAAFLSGTITNHPEHIH